MLRCENGTVICYKNELFPAIRKTGLRLLRNANTQLDTHLRHHNLTTSYKQYTIVLLKTDKASQHH